MRDRIATLLELHNNTIKEAGGTVPALQTGSSGGAAAPAATGGGGGDANAEARAWLAANPNDPRAAAVRQKLGGG
jgi:hypothetical protein